MPFRLERRETTRLAWAFAISLAIHLLCYGTYQTGKKFGWWTNIHLPQWMQKAKMLTELVRLQKDKPKEPPPQELPLVFVEVAPSIATTEPPKNASYYSSRNSVAANPDTDNKDTPKITGKQEVVPKTVDVERPMPLQPAAPETKMEPEVIEQKGPAPGDLALAKPSPEKSDNQAEKKPPRPRTIREALARQPQENRIPGEKMKQDGGVRRRLEVASLDAKATPFGTYDAMLIEAISQRWYTLLDQREYASDSRGKVVLQFRLHYDGRVTEMSVAENTVGELLGLICQKAVMDPAPYAAWPGDMRRMLGDSRKVQFTFYYN